MLALDLFQILALKYSYHKNLDKTLLLSLCLGFLCKMGNIIEPNLKDFMSIYLLYVYYTVFPSLLAYIEYLLKCVFFIINSVESRSYGMPHSMGL